MGPQSTKGGNLLPLSKDTRYPDREEHSRYSQDAHSDRRSQQQKQNRVVADSSGSLARVGNIQYLPLPILQMGTCCATA